MGKIKFSIIYLFFFLISLIPLRILYLNAYCIKYLNQYLFCYRTKTTLKNIRLVFPLYTDNEINKIYNLFYINFFRTIFEIIKVINLKKKDIKQRVKLDNIDIIKNSIKKKKPVVLMCGHHNNFEWLGLRISLEDIGFTAIYKPLSNKYLDKIIFAIRTRFGAQLVSVNKLKDVIIKNKKNNCVISFVADQVPSNKHTGIRMNFLNQSTLFHEGPEKITKLLNADAFYVEMTQLKAGYYSANFKKIQSENITNIYGKLLEKTIRKEPQNWLWSHNRWKR